MNKKTERVFQKKLNQLKNIYLVFSSEEYLLDKFEKRFKEKFVDESISDFNLSYIREEEEIFKSIVSQGNTLPIMSNKRFIIVKSGNIFKKNIGNFALFEKFIKDIPNSTILLIIINQDISKNKRKDIIEEYGEIINLAPPKYQNLDKWIKLQFKQRGKKVDYRGIKILEKMFNNNLQQLDSEIDKICTYVNGKDKIELRDIKKVISKDRRLKENEIFEFLDAISNREKQKSVYLFQHMITSGEVPQIILAMITRRIRLMLIIKDLKNQGMRSKKIASKIGIHPYPVKKIYKYVDNYSFNKLEELLDSFLQADIKVKTGQDKTEDAVLNSIIII